MGHQDAKTQPATDADDLLASFDIGSDCFARIHQRFAAQLTPFPLCLFAVGNLPFEIGLRIAYWLLPAKLDVNKGPRELWEFGLAW